MQIRQLQYFLAVAETRHFTQASEALYVSQSSLSQQIGKLESDLGVKLIRRGVHPIELTSAGKDFQIYARQIVEDINQLERRMQKYRADSEKILRIGVITGLGQLPFTEILSKFNTEYGDVRYSLTNRLSKALCDMLSNGEIDLALIAMPSELDTNKFEILHLQEDPFVAILPQHHACAREKVLQLKDLQNESFIFPTPDNVSYDIFMKECRTAGFLPRVIMQCNTAGRRFDLVKSELGISIISESAFVYFHKSDHVTAIPIKPEFSKSIVMIRRIDLDRDVLIDRFWNYVRHYWKA